jgi:hypothetical protein
MTALRGDSPHPRSDLIQEIMVSKGEKLIYPA